MTDRERLRALTDDLREDEVHEVLRFVESLLSSTPPPKQPVAGQEARHGSIISHEGMHRRVFGGD